MESGKKLTLSRLEKLDMLIKIPNATTKIK